MRVVQGGWEALTRDVASGLLDVAVAEVATAEQDASLAVERVGAHLGSFYCRAAHPLTSRTRLTFDDIASFPVALSPLPGRLAPFFERQGVAGRVDPTSGLFHPALTLDEVALMKRAVRETEAVSWAPDVLIADEVRQGSFVPLPFRADWARLNYGVIRRTDRPVTPALEAFLSELRSVEEKARGGDPQRRHRSHRAARTQHERARAGRKHST